MRAVTRIVLTAAVVGTATIGAAMAVNAQYYYPRPGYDYPPPPGYGGYGGYGWRTWNGCPPGYTVQGGVNRIVAPRAAAGEPGTVAHRATLSKAASADSTAAIRLVAPI